MTLPRGVLFDRKYIYLGPCFHRDRGVYVGFPRTFLWIWTCGFFFGSMKMSHVLKMGASVRFASWKLYISERDRERERKNEKENTHTHIPYHTDN